MALQLRLQQISKVAFSLSRHISAAKPDNTRWFVSRYVNKDLTPKDQDKDKDLTPKDQDRDKDLKNVLKESLRTRTRINIPDICCN